MNFKKIRSNLEVPQRVMADALGITLQAYQAKEKTQTVIEIKLPLQESIAQELLSMAIQKQVPLAKLITKEILLELLNSASQCPQCKWPCGDIREVVWEGELKIICPKCGAQFTLNF